MGLINFISNARQHVVKNGMAGLKEIAYELNTGVWRRAGLLYPYSTHIYDFDWDMLIILDACRVDLMEEVADEYSFVEGIDSVPSAGSSSGEWMRQTFTNEYASEMQQTVYITGNAWSSKVLSEDDFLMLDEVWKYIWDFDIGTIPARGLTDRAICVGREYSPDRMIVHYMQPHHPYVPKPNLGTNPVLDPHNQSDRIPIWDDIRAGNIDPDDVWDAYRENLRYVLDELELLINNRDAERVIITSDHGNLFEEFGLWSHMKGVSIPQVKKVPWCVTSANDTAEYKPEVKRPKKETVNFNVNERLRNLGYKI
jgi:hypothetical protein